MIAAEYLQKEGLDPVTRALLTGISVLDQQGAWTWKLGLVGFSTSITLLTVRTLLRKKRGIDWYALIHAVISSLGAWTCLYLDWVASEQLAGVAEPLRSVQCAGPLTSLHRILPAITMGYSVFDFLDGLTISLDFALHGAATLAVMILFIEVGAPQIVAPMLIMETSTIFLNMVKADFFPARVAIANQLCFLVSFFFARIVMFPMIWAKLMFTMWNSRGDNAFLECYPSHFMYTCFFFGLFYNTLNAHWFMKIMRKARRRIAGIERHTECNDLTDLATYNELQASGKKAE